MMGFRESSEFQRGRNGEQRVAASRKRSSATMHTTERNHPMSDEQWNPLRNTETEQQWNARHNREKDKPADEGLSWNPFRDLPRGRDRLARANEVLAESIHRADEDTKIGDKELDRRFGAELIARARAAQSRGRLPAHLLDNRNPDDDGGNAA